MTCAKISFVLFFLFKSIIIYSQGVGIPSSKRGFGFGNLRSFSGIRFNFIDKHVSKIKGINVTVWKARADSVQTGTVSGISIGIPLTSGTESKKGIGFGIFGVGATKNLGGINIGGLFVCVSGKDSEGTSKGISMSLVNKVNGEHRGITFGIVNYTRKLRGIQFGLVNMVKENPKGLRILPIFNMHFGKKRDKH